MIQVSENVTFTTEPPTLDKIKKKIIMVVKAIQRKGEDYKDADIPKEIVMMELNRQILENLFLIC